VTGSRWPRTSRCSPRQSPQAGRGNAARPAATCSRGRWPGTQLRPQLGVPSVSLDPGESLCGSAEFLAARRAAIAIPSAPGLLGGATTIKTAPSGTKTSPGPTKAIPSAVTKNVGGVGQGCLCGGSAPSGVGVRPTARRAQGYPTASLPGSVAVSAILQAQFRGTAVSSVRDQIIVKDHRPSW
jgi:hypothetical protein